MRQWVIVFLISFILPVGAIAETEVSSPVAKPVNLSPSDDTADNSKSFAFWSFHFLKNHSVELGVELPLNFGVHGSVRFTDTTYVRLGFGWVYEKFLGTFSRVAPHFGYISEDEANLMVDVMKNSLYLDARLGWIPYAKDHEGGPYIEVGISSMLFGPGKVDAGTLRNTLDAGDDIAESYSVQSNVYNATFHLGYQIPFEKKLKLNVDVGVIKIFRTDAVASDSMELKALSQEKYTELQSLLVKKGWIFPTVSVWISFVF